MARRLIWTEAAWSDLEEAANYIAKDSQYYAAAFVQEVRDAVNSLSEFALRGRIVPELDDPSVREIIVRSYRVIYRVSDDEAHILGVIHGARDLLPLWKREGRAQ